MKRTNEHINPILYQEIINKRLIKDIKCENKITKDHFKNNILAIVVARTNSKRLKNKTTQLINGKPTLYHLFKRLNLAKNLGYIDNIAFCTTKLKSDDKLIEIADQFGFQSFRGDSEDVLSRMILAINRYEDHNTILRVTGDDILIDPYYLNKTVKWHFKNNADYTDAKCLPSGTEVEVFNAEILKLIHYIAEDTSGTEYLTNYINNNKHQFNTSSLKIPIKHRKKLD